MLDLSYLLQNLDTVKAALARKNAEIDWDLLLSCNERRRTIQLAHDETKHRQSTLAKTLPIAKKKGEDTSSLLRELKAFSDQVADYASTLTSLEQELIDRVARIPNLPLNDVPSGLGSEDNVISKTWGTPPTFSFIPRAHWDIGEALGILDFERARKITGARFCLYKGLGAKLERALIQFMLDLHVEEHGYTEVLPPFIVNRDSLFGTGTLPKFESDLFGVSAGDQYPTSEKPYDWFLIPTAEVPVTNIHRAETLAAADLPIRYVAYTPCFRSEAGSYGKDVRGLIRQHQFNKVELVHFVLPENSEKALEDLTRHAEIVLERLELPYRRMLLCTGDMSFSSAKTYDLEVWMPGQAAYREISSCSTFTDFQARRAKIRTETNDGKKVFVHTLNGSGLAIGRTVVAILENYQNEDGSVSIPTALQPYMRGVSKLA